jgi:succinyl-CoA synthetase alpha subunit
MVSGFAILENHYYDSVFLMWVNKRLSEKDGVQETAVLMGTEYNKGFLSEIGITDPQIADANPNDLIVAVIAETKEIVTGTLNDLDNLLQGESQDSSVTRLQTLDDGLSQKPDANLAVISVPGEYAAREARKALESGLNVFLFSDNVSLEAELEMKKMGAEKGLLVMGPDCGTSLIGGIGIGFANNVRGGKIGVVGASGTGLQEFTCQIHNAGSGISHAIGTGSYDLADEIGGITTLMAFQSLESDPDTDVIVIISKPPGKKTLNELSQVFENAKKPLIGCFLGIDKTEVLETSKFQCVRTIDDAVSRALGLLGVEVLPEEDRLSDTKRKLVHSEKEKFGPGQKYVRGLFAGGTYCYQSQQVFSDAGIEVYSNASMSKEYQLADPDSSIAHTFVDLGEDYFTVGRPHPMIDGTARRHRILDESQDPQVAVLLLDFILGHNASMDPVGDLLDAIIEAKQVANRRGDHLCVVASICGTEDDMQELNLQKKMLEENEVTVFLSNAKAAKFCVEIVK